MQICFIRHAQPVPEINTGHIADPGLSELGVWQAERLSEWLQHEPVDHIISSPKRRARDTIQPLADRLGLDVVVDSSFSEIDRNSKIYLPPEILYAEDGAYVSEAEKYRASIKAGDYAAIGWDTPADFNKRINNAFEQLCQAQPGTHVVVACHGGVISRIFSKLVHTQERLLLRVFYTGISRVWVDADKQLLMSFNEVGHCCANRNEVTGNMRDGLTLNLPY